MAETLGAYYRSCAIPKPEPRIVTKTRGRKLEDREERLCRARVRRRDHGRCRIPDCRARGELHHLLLRSRAGQLKWVDSNCLLLCRDHHALRHAGEIQITGDANGEIVITGNVDRLKFRL